MWRSSDFAPALAEAYGPLKKISVDYALLEQASDIKVVTGDFSWDDLGSWDALYDHLPADDRALIQEGYPGRRLPRIACCSRAPVN